MLFTPGLTEASKFVWENLKSSNIKVALRLVNGDWPAGKSRLIFVWNSRTQRVLEETDEDDRNSDVVDNSRL